MDSVAQHAKVATWLELAVAPEWRRNDLTIRIHSVARREGGCYAISVDGRWLCVGNGGLTVFHGLSATLQFLKMLNIDDFEPGEAADEALALIGERHCLCTDGQGGLLPCRCASGMCAGTH